jgi:hypothetical protein
VSTVVIQTLLVLRLLQYDAAGNTVSTLTASTIKLSLHLPFAKPAAIEPAALELWPMVLAGRRQ